MREVNMCAVRGVLTEGGMCGKVIVGGKYCGHDGACKHKRTDQLHTFLNAAAEEGLVLAGVDAADLYIATFPERYAAALARIEA